MRFPDTSHRLGTERYQLPDRCRVSLREEQSRYQMQMCCYSWTKKSPLILIRGCNVRVGYIFNHTLSVLASFILLSCILQSDVNERQWIRTQGILTDNLLSGRGTHHASYCNTQPQGLGHLTHKKVKVKCGLYYALAAVLQWGALPSAIPSGMQASRMATQDDPGPAQTRRSWPLATLAQNGCKSTFLALHWSDVMTWPHLTAREAGKCNLLCALEEENKTGFGGLTTLSLLQREC